MWSLQLASISGMPSTFLPQHIRVMHLHHKFVPMAQDIKMAPLVILLAVPQMIDVQSSYLKMAERILV